MSPQKPAFPTLREPNNQPFFFSNATAPAPSPQSSPFRAPSFTTPRKTFDIDFSSPPDTASPLGQTDNDETPDAKPIPIEFKSSPSRTEKKRTSLFGFYGKSAQSPGRGEIRKPNSDAIVRRIHKKRRRAQKFDRQLVLGRSDVLDDSDDDSIPSPIEAEHKKTKAGEGGWLTRLFTFIHQYPDAPSILGRYILMLFNFFILAGFLYLCWSFYTAIRDDVNVASDDAVAEALRERAQCSRNYVDNRCGADTRVPALENACSNWELCMSRNEKAVRRAKLSAHTFAVIFNQLVEPISWKAMAFTFIMFVTYILVNNATLSLSRRPQEHPYPDVYRQPSGPYVGQIGHFTSLPGAAHPNQPFVGWQVDGKQQQLEYPLSPDKEHRSRSRSPEKKRIQL